MERVTKHKYLIHDVQVDGSPFISIDIQLPSNLKEIHGITVTNTSDNDYQKSAGTLALQSQDETDVFLIKELFCNWAYAINPFEENGVEVWYLDTLYAYVSGAMPEETPVSITAKSAGITGWYKPRDITFKYRVRIYIRYEEQ